MAGSRASTAAAGCAGLSGSRVPDTGRPSAPSPHAHLSQVVPRMGHRQHHQNLLEKNVLRPQTHRVRRSGAACSWCVRRELRMSHQEPAPLHSGHRFAKHCDGHRLRRSRCRSGATSLTPAPGIPMAQHLPQASVLRVSEQEHRPAPLSHSVGDGDIHLRTPRTCLLLFAVRLEPFWCPASWQQLPAGPACRSVVSLMVQRGWHPELLETTPLIPVSHCDYVLGSFKMFFSN